VSELTKKKGLHPRIEELLEHLEETRGALTEAVAHVAPVHRSARSVDGRWSVGEVLDHVHRVESSFTRLLNRRVSDARAAGHPGETETSSILDSVDRRRLTDRGRRIEAPELVVPRPGATVEEGLAALEASRGALLTALAGANGLALGTITHPHPIFGTMNMYQWALVLGFHDLRHADQIREIGGGSRGS
jgi:hypothetical protein